ncbi:hypothetical protein P154DRAFT_609695 [Amniculicola lignicola CBS 123094]|uniref:DUF8035 domain-containing protein n=1 Tax=Amniculicola lignicola CBS 123094 TaxID=1392246 RepID=A0A6A5WEA9_9PLEO|nr:hypothetical protein P154DRAFT_609695 [Amniculicola lignicola CBS 123094]
MMGSVLLSPKAPGLRRYSYTVDNPPPLPARRATVDIPPLKLKAARKLSTSSTGSSMDSRYYRSSSPRRLVNPARSSTGSSFADPYYDSYYSRGSNTSPRTSAERIPGSYHQHPYPLTSSSGTRSSALKYDSYSGRPRRNTLTEEDRVPRPVSALATSTTIPIRTTGLHHHHHHDRPASPLARSWDNRADTYTTQPPRREHKKIYSIDDSSHSAKLISERDVVETRRRDVPETRTYGVTSGNKTYHSKPLARSTDINDDGFSYTDPASMYRDTEPTWRRPRAGSLERSSRPTSLIMERAPRTSARELGPPPSTRGLDKFNSTLARTGSTARSSSIDRPRETPKYESYPETGPSRSTSIHHHTPTIHQDPRDPSRRDSYREVYERGDRDFEPRRHNTADRFEDREVTTRGFGIAPAAGVTLDNHGLDRAVPWPVQDPPPRARPESYPTQDIPRARQDTYPVQDVPRARPDSYVPPPPPPPPQYYNPDRADARMPDPRPARDIPPTYDDRPRDRDRDRREKRSDDRGQSSSSLPAVAGVVAGAGATLAAAEVMKSRDRDRDRDSDRERERDRRRDRDERERRERAENRRDRTEDLRDRNPEERRDRGLEDLRDRAPEERREKQAEGLKAIAPEERLPPGALGFAPALDTDRKVRDRRREEDGRERRSHRVGSSDDSSDDRPRHYVDRDVAREADRRKEAAVKEAPLDPDEEYRRRIAQEAERTSRAAREREPSDSDPEKERRRRDDRDVSRDRDEPRSRRGAPVADPRHSDQVIDKGFVQEPESLQPALAREEMGEPSRSVQIVTPPKDPLPAPKGILRRPTEKFPEEPDPIREGVAPHKTQLKGKEIPVGARWTKIDRRLVNPEALEQAQERFEERMDCVIVLRVLTKEDIQGLADRTRKIRESREDEYERQERKDREKDKPRHRSHRDNDDRDYERRHSYDDDDDEELDRRERERERDRPRMIESGR